ncbi:MAG: DNA polymerase [Ottowia sp.]
MGRAGLLEPVQSLPVSVKSAASGSLRRCTSLPCPKARLRFAPCSSFRFPGFRPSQPNSAKTIGFGQIDGMGQYCLAKSLGIDKLSAKTFIDRYFVRYPGTAEYMQRTKEQAAVQSFVETLSGRRLYLPNIRNKNANARAGAERTAINAPMQGAASDLIKRAMTDVSRWLSDGLKSKLIMRVHDELVLEMPEAKLDLVKEKLPQMMAKVDEEMLNCRW